MTKPLIPVFVLMAFIWLIGWLIACGRHQRECVQKGIRQRWGYLILLFAWPHYLGY